MKIFSLLIISMILYSQNIAKCQVMGHRKRLNQNFLASFMCKTKDGRILKIRDGLNNYQRKHFLPKINDIIVFEYFGEKNSFKFPIFLYIKER